MVGIDWKNRRATHGIKLAHSEQRAKGIGTDTVMALMRYAFDELQMRRLDNAWFPENSASQALYKNAAGRKRAGAGIMCSRTENTGIWFLAEFWQRSIMN